MTHAELVEKVARAIQDANGAQLNAWRLWKPEAEAAIRVVVEECVKVARSKCERCGGAGWMWAHELGIGSTTDDTKYACAGRGECVADALRKLAGDEP